MNDIIIRVLKTPFDERDRNDYLNLLEYLQQVPFFQILRSQNSMPKQEFFQNLSQIVSYQMYEDGSPIYHHGDQGGTFYLILRGQVSEYLPKSEVRINQEQRLKQSIRNYSNIVKNKHDELLFRNNPRVNFYLDKGIISFQFSKYYNENDYFGQTALIMNQHRDRTMVATKTSHFLVINRKIYFQTFPINPNLNQETNELLQSFYDYFQAISKEQKEEIKIFSSLFKQKKFNQNDVVYNTNDEAQHIYFVISGSVQMQYNCDSQNFKKNDEQQLQKCVRLCDYSEGQFFGEIEFFKKTNRLFSVIVNKGCLTYYCSYQAFAEIQQITKKTCNVIKQQHELKYESLLERIQIIQNNQLLKNIAKHGQFEEQQIKKEIIPKMNPSKNNKIFQKLIYKTCNTFFDTSVREKPLKAEISHQHSNIAKNSIFLDQIFYDRTGITSTKIQKKKQSNTSRSYSPNINQKKDDAYSFPFKVITHTNQKNLNKTEQLNTIDKIFEKRQKVHQFITESRQKSNSPHLTTAENNLIKYKEIPIKMLLNVNIDLFDAENQPKKQYLIRLQNVQKLHEKKIKTIRKI